MIESIIAFCPRRFTSNLASFKLSNEEYLRIFYTN